jgi:hypothetical protein
MPSFTNYIGVQGTEQVEKPSILFCFQNKARRKLSNLKIPNRRQGNA